MSQIAYIDLSEREYIVLTMCVFMTALIGSIVIKDIFTVFNFIAAFSVNAMTFFFPAYFYLVAESEYLTIANEVKIKYHRVACIFMFIGVINFGMGMDVAVMSLH